MRTRKFNTERRCEMSRDYHATEFIGRLAADPETKYGETNGTARTRFRVLVNEEWKDRNEQVQKHVESYLVVAFNGLAEACGNFLSRGRRVFVRGRNRTRTYEGQGGKKRWVTEVIAETVQFLDGPRDEDKSDQAAPHRSQDGAADDADFERADIGSRRPYTEASSPWRQ
jgi:single-strand DNA-binding protein